MAFQSLMGASVEELSHIAAEYAATSDLTVGPLSTLLISGAFSALLEPTRGVIHCVPLVGAKGLFRKDLPQTERFGRCLCDFVKSRFSCGGFFTTDELPKYGLGRREMHQMFDEIGGDPARDVIIVMVYKRDLALRVRAALSEVFSVLADSRAELRGNA